MKKFILLVLFGSILSAQAATKENIAQLYVATFDRASEKAGLDYWLYDSGLNLEGIAESFFDQIETKERYPSYLKTDEFITAVYRNLFDREPDEEGLKYWREELENGNIPRNEFILAVINGALGDDKTVMLNKQEVSLYFADRGLSDLRMAQFCMAGVDKSGKSVKEAESMIDDFAKVRGIVDSGEDKRESYFLFDINGTDSGTVYKLDGCIFPDENTTFSYRIYSDYSADITYQVDGEKVTYPCIVKEKSVKVYAEDGEAYAPFLKDFTAFDGDTGIYYRLEKIYNGEIISIENNGTVANYIDKEGYHLKSDIVSVYKKIVLDHRGIKPLKSDEKTVEYGYMRASERDFIHDANGDLYIYKGGSCIYPLKPDTVYYFEIYNDNTMRVIFDENGESVETFCGVQYRYRKVYPEESIKSAPVVDNAIYYDPSEKRYYSSDSVYRGTLIKVYNSGVSAIIKDIPGYHYQKMIYSAYETDPLSHKGSVVTDESVEESGYMRVSQQTYLYNLRGEEYAYMTTGCEFPDSDDSIFRFFVYRDGNVTIADEIENKISTCRISEKFKIVDPEDGNVNAGLVKDGFYYSEKTGRYYRAVNIYKGTIVSIFNDGQVAYIRDGDGYYFWKYINEALEPMLHILQ